MAEEGDHDNNNAADVGGGDGNNRRRRRSTAGRYRRWVFTWNAPQESPEDLPKPEGWTAAELSQHKVGNIQLVRYLVAQKERGTEAQALHWQGYIELTESTRLGNLRTAAVALRSGTPAGDAAALKQAISIVKTLPAASLRHFVALARDLFDAGYPEFARQLFEAVLPVADATLSRTVLFGLGNVHEIQGQPQTAADYYLRAALPADRRAQDALALRARLLAALSLARAGQREEARAQFEWLIKNSKDPKQAEFARQELKKL